MKIYLDLLPEKKKKEIKRRKIFRVIIYQEFLFLFPIVVFIGILFSINAILKIQQGSLNTIYSFEQSRQNFQELKGYENKFKEINSQASLLLKINKGHLYWSQIFYELNKIVPAAVSFSDLTTKDYRVYLVGKAKTRDDLLKFQENMNNAGCFSDINVPLSNLVVKENIDFQMDFTINENCLKKK